MYYKVDDGIICKEPSADRATSMKREAKFQIVVETTYENLNIRDAHMSSYNFANAEEIENKLWQSMISPVLIYEDWFPNNFHC